jgi:hypothetical protein
VKLKGPDMKTSIKLQIEFQSTEMNVMNIFDEENFI